MLQSVLVKDLAVQVGIDKTGVQKHLKKLGIKTHRMRRIDTGNQPASAVTEAEARQYMAWREANGFTGKPFNFGGGK